MRRFMLFVKAAGTLGLLSVVAALSLFLVSVYEHIQEKNVTSYIFLACAALMFCVGSFLAWLEEHRKYEAEKSRHENPNFYLNIETVLTAYDDKQNLTTLCFAASLLNLGSVSNASGWCLRYQSPSVDMTVKFISLPQDTMPFPVVGGRNLILKRLELLPARTLSSLERGHTKHGRVLFELPGDRRDEIYSGAAQMWIGCLDNTGRLCQAAFKTGPDHKVSALTTYPDEESAEGMAASKN